MSDTASFSDILLGLLLMFAGYCTLHGFVHILICTFVDQGPLQRWRLNRRPNTLLDDVILRVNDEITRCKDYSIIVTKDRFGNSEEELHRKDGKVKITNLWNNGKGRFLRIEIEGVGTYRGYDIKPYIAELLEDTCKKLKQYQAIQELLPQGELPLDAIPY